MLVVLKENETADLSNVDLDEIFLPFSHWEKVPEGRMRANALALVLQSLASQALNRRIRATFPQWGKDELLLVLHSQPVTMQQWLRISIGLVHALEHQITSGLKCERGLKIGTHRFIRNIPRILPIHHFGHALQRFQHLGLRTHAVPQPIRHMLR